jgi:hypothetical protein
LDGHHTGIIYVGKLKSTKVGVAYVHTTCKKIPLSGALENAGLSKAGTNL